MRRLNQGRRLVLAAGAAAVAGFAAVPAQPADIHGTVTYAEGNVIPKGRLEIRITPPSSPTEAPQDPASVDSDGRARTLDFTLPMPAGADASSPLRIVARLIRADGWLLARGSSEFRADHPVHITLYTVMY